MTASGRRPPSRRDEARAHLRQRLDHPRHRPAAQRCVAGEEAGEGMRRDQRPSAAARRCRHCRDRARSSGSASAADADAVHAPGAVGARARSAAERAHGRGGAQHVLAFEQARDRVSRRRRARRASARDARSTCRPERDAPRQRAGFRGNKRQCGGCVHARTMSISRASAANDSRRRGRCHAILLLTGSRIVANGRPSARSRQRGGNNWLSRNGE